VVKLVHTVQ